ncbi:MAG: response regulator transcription factor [Prevotella sp.]|nr:response regulator transcription factor [Prevotella sp.]MBQ3361840.1 response regulator transcription factor [Prevotella sp.]MBQ6406104.1 response regulator transcription factor [Prevotella sp.]
MNKYRVDVNIVDDHTMFAEGLAAAVNKSDVLHVSRLFTTLEACRQALCERRPDVLLLDISMPDGSGVAFCEEMLEAHPKMKLVAITIHDEYSVIQRMLDVGVHGYLLKSSSVEELEDALVRVWKGERYVSPQVADILRQADTSKVFLSAIEKQVLELLCLGHTNPEIANRMHLSTETINWYRKRLLSKFGVRNTVSLVALVLREHILTE